jgi:hypothetical protein
MYHSNRIKKNTKSSQLIEKNFGKIQYLFVKKIQQTKRKNEFSQCNKGTYANLTGNIMFKDSMISP